MIGRAEVSLELLSFSVITLIRKGSLCRKAYEHRPGVGMSLHVKFSGDECRNGSAIPGYTDTQSDNQTDRKTKSSLHINL